MSVVLLNNVTLSSSPTASRPLLIEGERVTLQWKIVTGVDPGTIITWYLEFTDGNPNDSSTEWFREVDEQDAGAGVVTMAEVTREFIDNAGNAAGGLSAGTFRFSCQFVRQAQFVRLQAVSNAAVVVTVSAPFGSLPVG